MANSDSRKFGVQFTGADNGPLVGFQQYGADSVLYVANNIGSAGGSIHNTNLANVKWHNGVDEVRISNYVAFVVVNSSGTPQVITTEGIQPEVPPQVSPLAISTENDTYLRFKHVTDNATFEEAIYQIIALNNAAGAVYGEPEPIEGQATTSQVKTWAEANLNIYTNYTVGATTTTEAPTPTYAGSIWQITNEGPSDFTIRYYPLQQDDINNPVTAMDGSPLGAGQQRNICSLASSETEADVTPFADEGIITANETGDQCNYNGGS
jgi:hypothetical protein